MKFSAGTIILIVVALALMIAMVITLTMGGNRSRHGYGFLLPAQQPPAMVATGGRVDSYFFSDAISMEKRYLTSDFSNRS